MKQSISGYTKLAGVIAQPIKHSLSPKIHNAAYEQLNIDAVYLAFEVNEANFNQALESVKTLDMLGVNISMPYKRLAYEACDELSEEAQLIGVVNTVIQRNGRLLGYNTDGIGFVDSLLSEEVDVANKSLTILGAGGAARAIICQCALSNVKEINVFKRKNSTYQQIERELKEIADETGTAINLFDYHDEKNVTKIIQQSDILVNGTQVGMGEDKNLPISNMDLIHANQVVVDLIYHPLETNFLKEAKARKAKTINGLGMLVYQAAYAFRLMTEQEMPVESIKQLLENEWN